jgi:hypothetical protein
MTFQRLNVQEPVSTLLRWDLSALGLPAQALTRFFKPLLTLLYSQDFHLLTPLVLAALNVLSRWFIRAA